METILFAFLGSFCAGLVFNVRGYKLFFSGLSGMVGWIVYFTLINLTGHSVTSIFAGSVAIGIFSETAARRLKTPSTIFSIPGMFPIVPGIAAYETIRLMAANDMLKAGGKLFETLAGAGSIAFGILLVTAAFRFVSRPKTSK